MKETVKIDMRGNVWFCFASEGIYAILFAGFVQRMVKSIAKRKEKRYSKTSKKIPVIICFCLRNKFYGNIRFAVRIKSVIKANSLEAGKQISIHTKGD